MNFEQSSVSYTMRSNKKSCNIFRSTQKYHFNENEIFWIYKFSELQECCSEFCFPPKDAYKKVLFHFSINSIFKTLLQFKYNQQLWIFEVWEFEKFCSEFCLSPKDVYKIILIGTSFNFGPLYNTSLYRQTLAVLKFYPSEKYKFLNLQVFYRKSWDHKITSFILLNLFCNFEVLFKIIDDL